MSILKKLDQNGRTPTIKTERLILRAIDFGDELELLELFSQNEVQEFTTIVSPFKLANAKQLIAKRVLYDADPEKLFYSWAIITNEKGMLKGECSFSIEHVNSSLAILGYILSKEYWGQGIIPEAVAEIINFGFNNHPIEFFQIPFFEGNTKSGRVAQKLGFTLDGVIRGHYFTKGVLHNTVIYSLSRDEWEQQHYYKLIQAN